MEEDYSISLAKFLSRYELLCGKDLKKLTHHDVKVLFPYLKRASKEFIRKNPYLVASGEVILVNDGHDTLPYFVPLINEEAYDEDYSTFVYEKNIRYDYASMSVYELKQLLNKKFSSSKQRHLAKNELINRGLVLKRKYNRNEEKRKKYEEE